MTAGYSGTPLPKKLGLKNGARLAWLNAPPGIGPFDGVETKTSLRGTRPFDVIVLFCDRASELRRRFAPAAARLATNGGLWIAWPKKSSGVETDIGEALVRATGLDHGLVDNKICAIDETWSGLRFVVRLRDRRKK
jgi:hypothetical protein